MSAENPSVPLSSIMEGDDIYEALTGGTSNAAGVKVTREKALGHSAIWRGVSLIANDIGRHWFGVYKYVGDGLKEDSKHQAAAVMRKPNSYMTPFTFRQTLQAHVLLSGNGYAFIVRDKNAKPVELLPLDPDRTWPIRVNGELWYVTECDDPIPGKRRNPKKLIKTPSTDMLHIKGLGFDGLCGYPVTRILRDTIGGALAARDYGSRYFRNNATPGIVLEVPAGMKDPAISMLRKSWAELHQGVDNAHRPAILRDGVKLASWAANARDAQLLENRQFDSRDVANIIGVPPHKVGDPSRTAYNSLESENQDYQETTLDGWFTAWGQEADCKLLTEDEKENETHTCRFDPRPLARVPLATRGTYYTVALMNGWLNVDEVRGYEGKNPLPGGIGKVYRNPVNVTPSAPAPATDPAADPNAAPGDSKTPNEGNP